MAEGIPQLPSGDTLMVEKVMRIANLIEAEVEGKPGAPPGVVFLTSTEWGTLMRELRSKLGGVMDAGAAEFFKTNSFLVGNVTFRNAGSDDVDAVMLANKMYEEQSGFAWKKTHLRTG